MVRRAGSSTMILLLIFLLGFPLCLEAEAELRDKVHEAFLENGLKIILLENHRSPIVTFQVWYRVGSRNEMWGKTGLSHMLEHMMFKGTKRVGAEHFSGIIQEDGGNDNAFTSSDYTAYFENLISDKVIVAIGLESDRMENLVFREEDFRTERKVVMEERRLRTEDDPHACVSEQMEAGAFQIAPYHWPVIGWMEDIKRFTLEDVKSHYRTFYHPANAFVVVVGDFKGEDMLRSIRQGFGKIPEGSKPIQERGQDPVQQGERRIVVRKEVQLPYLEMGYHVPNLTDADSYVLEVIAAILSGGKSSRFDQHLVHDKMLVLAATADHPLLSRDPHLFTISAEVLPGKDITEVEKALDHELALLRKELVGDRELQKVKNQLEASFVYAQDSLFSQAVLLGEYEMVTGWKAIDRYLPSIRSVTAEDIMRVAKKYLVAENRTVGILAPLESGKELPVRDSPLTKEPVVRQEGS